MLLLLFMAVIYLRVHGYVGIARVFVARCVFGEGCVRVGDDFERVVVAAVVVEAEKVGEFVEFLIEI